jgi:cellulose synthase/poly-beta-1,6-N-acetylglucosamine synthase-like glycosyltransferase
MDRLLDVRELLDSIAAQSYRPIETILVVQQARDLLEALYHYVGERQDANIRLYFNASKAGLSSSRNLGVREAEGDVLAFVDDDVIISPDWAEQVMATFADGTAIGMTGPALPLWQDESMRWLPDEFHWLISCTSWVNWETIRPVRNVWGHSMAFRREAFEQAGLFQTALGLRGLGGPVAEDSEFSLRVQVRTGKRLLYNPRAVVWHKVRPYRLGWRYIAQRSYWIGRSRHLLTRAYAGDENALKPEMELLKRILGNLPRRIARTVLHHPTTAWQQFLLTVWSLSFVSIGYLSGLLSLRDRRRAEGN